MCSWYVVEVIRVAVCGVVCIVVDSIQNTLLRRESRSIFVTRQKH